MLYDHWRMHRILNDSVNVKKGPKRGTVGVLRNTPGVKKD